MEFASRAKKKLASCRRRKYDVDILKSVAYLMKAMTYLIAEVDNLTVESVLGEDSPGQAYTATRSGPTITYTYTQPYFSMNVDM